MEPITLTTIITSIYSTKLNNGILQCHCDLFVDQEEEDMIISTLKENHKVVVQSYRNNVKANVRKFIDKDTILVEVGYSVERSMISFYIPAEFELAQTILSKIPLEEQYESKKFPLEEYCDVIGNHYSQISLKNNISSSVLDIFVELASNSPYLNFTTDPTQAYHHDLCLDVDNDIIIIKNTLDLDVNYLSTFLYYVVYIYSTKSKDFTSVQQLIENLQEAIKQGVDPCSPVDLFITKEVPRGGSYDKLKVQVADTDIEALKLVLIIND